METWKIFLQYIILSDIRQVIEGMYSITNFLVYTYACVGTVYTNLEELYLKLEIRSGSIQRIFIFYVMHFY